MTGTFGEVFGPRNQTGSEPLLSEVQIGSSGVPNFDIYLLLLLLLD